MGHQLIDIFLSDPPKGYLSPALDLLSGLDKIRKKAASAQYSSQFAFDFDINHLISRANDGHLQLGLCSQEIFRFRHGFSLVSISPDGLERPEIYALGKPY